MTHTGVFATKEEQDRAFDLAANARTTPVMALSIAQGLAGEDFASRAWRNANAFVHKCALDHHGLPEIQGFYGMTEEGEFVSI